MKKHLIGALALTTVTVLALSGCGGGAEPTSEQTTDTTEPTAVQTTDTSEATPVTINFMASIYSDNTKGLYEGYIAEFNKEHPEITINLEMQSWDNINDVIKTKVQAGEPPDLLEIDAFSSYVEDDLLYSADEVLSPETIADFQPSFVANATMDGKQYGFPSIASARALFYNDDLFTQAGLDPTKDLQSWDEVYDAAKKISDLGKDIYGYGMPLGAEENQAQLGIWAFTNGGSFGDAETLTINDPKNIEAAEFIKKMVDDGVTQPDAGATDRTPMFNNVFCQGKIGMMVGLPPFIGMLAEQAPDMKYSIHTHPGKEAGTTSTLGVADHFMIFKTGDEAKGKAAGLFLDFFYRPENYAKFVDTEGFLPVTVSGAAASTNPDFAAFNAALPTAKFYPSTNPKWGSAQGLIQQQFGTIAQGADPKEVLDNIQAEIDSEI
ncbi:MAG: extracellular solute-binding protein [Propionibacteriaceae bacterium]|jgi:multiple sugar transport system substrate-binding protein|nr:extracellular solute-binding protein [Propionibacteriaceae bacterium]